MERVAIARDIANETLFRSFSGASAMRLARFDEANWPRNSRRAIVSGLHGPVRLPRNASSRLFFQMKRSWMNCGKNELSTRLERSRVLTVTGVSTGKRANLANWGEFDFRSPRRQSDAERATIGLPVWV